MKTIIMLTLLVISCGPPPEESYVEEIKNTTLSATIKVCDQDRKCTPSFPLQLTNYLIITTNWYGLDTSIGHTETIQLFTPAGYLWSITDIGFSKPTVTKLTWVLEGSEVQMRDITGDWTVTVILDHGVYSSSTKINLF